LKPHRASLTMRSILMQLLASLLAYVA